MTIFILDPYPSKIPAMVDDKSLEKMIKNIAQVLCNVHHMLHEYPYWCHKENIPLDHREGKNLTQWENWARECKANYLYLVELGFQLIIEYSNRFIKFYPNPNDENKVNFGDKFDGIITWCSRNIPDLPSRDHEIGCGCPECDEGFKSNTTQFPLVMPKKYLIYGWTDSKNIILSYRNYYESKTKKEIK